MFAATITSKLPASLAQAVGDAVLLGDIQEIDRILQSVEGGETFPHDIRTALEALRYFRLYYGKNGECEPTSEKDRQNVAQLESLWRQELMAMIGPYVPSAEKKFA